MEDCSVKKYGAIGDGVHDDTSAIQTAISNSTCIYFPAGTYKITSTILFSRKTGVHMYGDGDGSNGLGSSKIYWAGPAGGIILQLYSCANCTIERLALQGIFGGLATNPGVGIYISADNANGASHWNVIRDCSVSNIMGSPGYGVLIGSTANADINTNSFENVLLVICKVGFVQMGTQTVNNYCNNVECLQYTSMGAMFIQGTAVLTNCSFYGDNTATADVQIGAGMLWASIKDSYHEILQGRPSTAVAYDFPNTGNRPWGTEINNCRVLWNIGPGNIINYQQHGPLSITNCNFDGIGSGGVININNNAATPQPLTIYGNYLVSGVASYLITGSVDYQNVTQQSVYISTLDLPGSDSATNQNWFSSPSSFVLSGSTTYEVEGVLLLSRSLGTNPHTTSFVIGGTAKYSSIMLVVKSTVNGTDSTVCLTTNQGVVTPTVYSAHEFLILTIKGILRVSSKGTFTPQYVFSSSPGGTPTILTNSYLKLTPLGNNSLKTIGNFQ